MRKEADAVVIGAGVAGSGIAYALAAQGWNVVLLDKDRFPRHKACGEFLSPDAQSSLRAFGLEGVVRELAPAFITHVRLHTERGMSLEIPLPGPAWGVSRYALDARLQQSAVEAGVRMHAACPVSDVTATNDGYRIDCEPDREPISFYSRIVIGAGGRRSLQAQRLPKSSANHRSFVGVKAHYESGAEVLPVVDLFFFRGGYVGISPVEGGRLNVAALLGSAAFRKLGGASAIERIVEHAMRSSSALRHRMAGLSPIPGSRAATFPVVIRPAPRPWSEYPVIGDAVAVIPPFCGDGMAMALRSAELCAPLAGAYLSGECTEAQWRERYTAQVKKQFTGALRWGSVLDRLLINPVLATLLLRIGVYAPWMAERMVRSTRLDG
ncbi:NAD(P)/FAD-dependent oxidoreductase [Cohnella sp. GCM10027633]|uniref:NAD(P)/FAD-dependent oxidoreductase n=1 Tax=unclassified Cohnella TaxID=2636738 RepID=UPI003627A460